MTCNHPPMVGGGRRKLYMTDDAIAGWRAFSLRHGTTPTAIVEVLGQVLGALETPTGELPSPLREAVLDARLLAAERRRRDPPRLS